MASDAEMSRITLLSIPSELFEHHIFSALDLASTVACAFTCSKLQKIIIRSRITALSRPDRQMTILENIFQIGNVNLLLWFYRHLQYPHIKIMEGKFREFFQFCFQAAIVGMKYY